MKEYNIAKSLAPSPKPLVPHLIKYDLSLALKKGSGIGNMLCFYFMVSVLFVFGTGSNPKDTAFIAPAVIWVCALLVQSISASRIFADDYEDGTLAQLLLHGDLPEKIILARMISNWLTGGFLIILFSPLIAIFFGMEWDNIKKLVISLACGTPLLSIIGVAVAALTLGIKKSGIIFGILAFPLYIPVLIFGASWVSAPEVFSANMSLLLAMCVFMLPLGIAASVAAVRIAFD